MGYTQESSKTSSALLRNVFFGHFSPSSVRNHCKRYLKLKNECSKTYYWWKSHWNCQKWCVIGSAAKSCSLGLAKTKVRAPSCPKLGWWLWQLRLIMAGLGLQSQACTILIAPKSNVKATSNRQRLVCQMDCVCPLHFICFLVTEITYFIHRMMNCYWFIKSNHHT